MPQALAKKKDAIDKALRKIKKKDKEKLERTKRPPKPDLPDLDEPGVNRVLELLKDVEANNGHRGIRRILKGEGIIMTVGDIREIDERRADRLAELEAEE